MFGSDDRIQSCLNIKYAYVSLLCHIGNIKIDSNINKIPIYP